MGTTQATKSSDSTKHANLAPRCEIYINDLPLNQNLVNLVRYVEYESTDNMADMAKVIFDNPKFVISKFKQLQPGNEMSLWMGYGENIEHVGRVDIVRHHPTYPRSGMPTIEIIGYTADRRLMDHAPPKPKKDKNSKKGASGLSHQGKKYSDVVKEKAEAYEFAFKLEDGTPTIDTNIGKPRDFIQPFGMSDYDFIRSMANITGAFFWVDGTHGTPEKPAVWTMHFKAPGSESYLQKETYDFRYNQGDSSTLLEFMPELLIQGQKTEVKAQYMDDETGEMVEVVFPKTTPNPSPDTIPAPQKKDNSLATRDNLFEEDHTSGVAIKLFIGEYSFEAQAPRNVDTPEELELWAKNWYKEQKDNFVMADGVVVGFPFLMSQQIHNLSGMEGGLEGLYYFSRVKHKIDSGGYECEFSVRKVIKD